MSLHPLLVKGLAVLTSPWATGIATVLLFFTGGNLIYGEQTPWLVVVTRVIAGVCLLALGANFLSALGLLS